MKKLSKTDFKWLGIFIASLTICITILSLDLSAFFHPEAAVLIIGGTSSYTLIANRDQPIAYRIGEGAVFFGWLGLLIAWTHIAYNNFYDFRPNGLGLAVSYSMHPLFYGYIIKFFSMAFED